MAQDRKPFFSLISPFKSTGKREEPGAEDSPEMQARQKLEQRIEQALAPMIDSPALDSI